MLPRNTLSQITVAVILGFVISGVLGTGVVVYSLFQTEQRARENTARFQQNPPAAIASLNTIPSMNQESIDKAIEMYQIRVPSSISGPKLDLALTDRGLTTRRGALSQISVTIGPDAFTSWPMLASTIAHEVEVHCRQNFFAIHLMDISGLDGTGQAEREAYVYELHNASRFGLAPYDQDLIRSTVNYYYPDRSNRFARQMIPIRFWMDRLSALDPVMKMNRNLNINVNQTSKVASPSQTVKTL